MESIVVIPLAEAKDFFGVSFPLAFGPGEASRTVDSLTRWMTRPENRTKVDELLLRHKAILFRGWQINEPQDFHDVVEALGYDTMEYQGGAAVRTQITPRVFTANESPPSEKIPYHHELAQTPAPPTHVFFYCERPPETGGATPILPSSEVYRKMTEKHPEFMHKLEHVGVRYLRVMPCDNDPTSAIGRGWKATFNAETVEEAEKALRRLGSEWEWLDGSDDAELKGCLKTITAVVPGVRVDARTNEKTFFNSAVAAYTGWNDKRNSGNRAVQLADGSYCGEAEMMDAQQIMSDIEVVVPWQAGDIMLLDNRTVMHSRQPFTGPRRILASLCRDASR